MNAENLTIDDVLVYLRRVRDEFHKKGRSAKDLPAILPPEEKLQETNKISGELLADWRFWRQHRWIAEQHS